MPLTMHACVIGEQIVRVLRAKYGEHARMLRIEMDEDRVVLRGQAQSYYQKQLWLKGAVQVVGSENLVDLTEVCGARLDA